MMCVAQFSGRKRATTRSKMCGPAISFILLALVHGASAISMTSSTRMPRQEFVHKIVLDQMQNYVMLWTPLEDQIIIELQVRTLGYVGLGFSPTGGMKGADIVIGWIDEQGILHFSDRHASGNRTPTEDAIQDYRLLGGFANDTHTTIRFSRPWITCDTTDDYPLTGDTLRLIWAYDPVKPDPNKVTLPIHNHRGSKSIYLKDPKIIDPPSSVQHWDIRSPNVELPSNINTLYWCKLYKIPDLAWKHHMVGYLPLISEMSLPHVHHMILYECTIHNSEDHLDRWTREKGAQCYSQNMPLSWNACGTPIIAWAIGSQGEILPDHVGFPLGEKHGGATYFLLEIHYDNPEYKKGFVDNSGLRIMYTDQIRQHDAGVLTLGHKVEPSMIIPPNRVWKTKAHCTSDCTDRTIPQQGINVFSGILHAHLLGEGISLQQIRNGIELDPIISDDSYDFNYQQSRVFKQEKLIKPGDHMITTCTYNASKKNKPTFGGFGTDDEMCLVFLAYYPRINLGECYSRPDLAVLFDVFGIQDLYENTRIMNIFSQDHFDSSLINSDQERSIYNDMTGLYKAGSNADKFRLVDFFRIINISQPMNLRDKSFYDILTDYRTWQDEGLINKLEKAVSNFQYEPSCLYSGRGLVQRLPKKAKSPHYIRRRTKGDLCVKSTIENIIGELLQPIEDTNSFVDNSYTPIREPDRSIKKSNQHVEEPAALNRNNANTNYSSFIFLLIVVVISLLVS